MIKELSISGGGVKGFAYIGVLHRLHELGMLKNLKKVIGVSIGSFFAVCLVIGYSPKELIDIFFDYDLKLLKDLDLTSFFTRKSLLKGEKYREFLLHVLSKKINKDMTLKELYSKFPIELVIVVSCVNKKELNYISYNTDPDLKVIDSIMMSSAIPCFFPPVYYKGFYFVDGGVLNNNPIDILGEGGFLIKQKSNTKNTVEINNFFDYIGSVIHMIYKNIKYDDIKEFKNVIEVECGDIKVTSFNITKDEKLTLINYGIKAVDNFFRVP